jgi:hypothetical protein
MSSHWIKIEKSTPDKPEIRAAARICRVGKEKAFYAFFLLWSFFDSHSEDGFLPGLTLEDVDDTVGLKGFGQAMVNVGWLVADDMGINVANWERHNGKSAKARAQTMRRVQAHRARKRWDPAVRTCNAPSVTKAIPE